ncbi:dihydrodipicolinate synthase family protein [Flavimaricola marinus]|uniref:N-acetylneuraminate lyase n=1 Tax=Flavimaricola marinus TaxID=1819565 RepID=A0A238LGS7_9RHOB|nr:dihydrodipicolinate synthase family protein [Flavimaricola marinus]SMY08899.1 N-acetylneuraminate lyase [Flavimaricola marinus]
MSDFRPTGIWGAVLLPISADGEIDFSALADLVDVLCQSGVAGIYTNGTAAEFFNQTEAEFDKITELVLDRTSKAGVHVQIGVSNSNPRVARERLCRMVGRGVAAVQVTLPDWWPPSPTEQLRFLAGMAEVADGLPMVLYNPPTAKARIDVQGIMRLRAATPTLVGVKVAGGDEDWFAQRRAMLGDMSVFVAGHTVAFGRPLGADGAYSNVACLSPRGAVTHWEQIETDPTAALDLERRFRQFLQSTMIPLARDHGLSDAALDKAMAAAGAWGAISPQLMWPYSSATPEMIAQIRKSALDHVPELIGVNG